MIISLIRNHTYDKITFRNTTNGDYDNLNNELIKYGGEEDEN